ncbi:hypothetical protein C8Q79DRAFT_15374 [Trametes meyenii]|nr:hypothetical protein C8Q79DRAFT_15374 [Trametes meyenii]
MGSGRSTLPSYFSRTSNVAHPGPSTQASRSGPQPNAQTRSVYTPRFQRPAQPIFSELSDPGVPDRMWFSQDFMLGAGMVVIQPSSGRIVVLRETVKDAQGRDVPYWFLPKGRKDVGESLEEAALREAHEESGYRVSFLPLIMPTNAPTEPGSPEHDPRRPITEPIYVQLMKWHQRRYARVQYGGPGGEYLTFWYVGQIPANATIESGTRMPDEVGYQTYLLTYEDATRVLGGTGMDHLVHTAYALWQHTQRILNTPASRERSDNPNANSSANVMVQSPAGGSVYDGDRGERRLSRSSSVRA